MGEKYNIAVNFDSNDIHSQLVSVVDRLRGEWRALCEGKARTSVYHKQYLTLDLNLGETGFFNDSTKLWVISWAIKARAELINLNFKPWLLDGNQNCSLCNLQEDETVSHFVSRCPVLKEFRKKWFNKTTLSETEFYSYLNGKDWRVLGHFLSEAWGYRWGLIQEFNH